VYSVASRTPISGATSATFHPAAVSFNTPMIYSWVYRVFSISDFLPFVAILPELCRNPRQSSRELGQLDKLGGWEQCGDLNIGIPILLELIFPIRSELSGRAN
jgi:hypothetical protein